ILDNDLVIRERFPEDGPRYDSGRVAPVAADIVSWTKKVPISASEPPARFFESDDGGGWLVAPVMTRNGVVLYVSVAARKVHLDPLDEAAVTGAAAAAAIEMSRERAVLEAEERAQAGVLEEVVSANGAATESLRRRATRIRLELDEDHAVL